MRSLYLAAPLFNPQERSFNELLATMLAPSFRVYLPQRDGVLVPTASGREQFDYLSQEAYRSDLQAIGQADVLLAVLDGRAIDEGVAFELGFATALGKQCVALKTDSRVLLPHGDNPMIVGAICLWLESVEDLRCWIKSGASRS